MNDSQFEGQWKQIKGNLRKTFAKLTDDDVEEIKGRKQNLIGKIQERYGDAKEAAQKRVNEFLGTLEKATS